MSVQFGRWNFHGVPATPDYLASVRALVAPYGPDGEGRYCMGGVDLLYRFFHTTKESSQEQQPFVSRSGAVINWDGRLDNREELVRKLNGGVSIAETDVSIVAAAYDRWETGCFRKLLGDWAFSIWNPGSRSLILAKDFVGTRHLYYSTEQNEVVWSTILDPLVLLAGKSLPLDEGYIAGWLSSFPAAHLTPYVGIHSVPPSSFVKLTPGRQEISRYWAFDGAKKIRYHEDAEYEEHFRAIFAESVRRRLRSDSPILAELSGGMDSSSIVCMADIVMARGAAETPRVDTVSYYNDCEPSWNERPYFSKVEEQRGRVGLHIDANAQSTQELELGASRLPLRPGSSRSLSSTRLIDWMCCQKHRVVLSGVAGDEVMGGVPTAVPELEDLLAQGRLDALAHQLKVWALIQRRPWFHLLWEATMGFLPPDLIRLPINRQPAHWLNPMFVKRHRSLLNYEKRWAVFGSLPSFQENLSALEALRKQLACTELFAGYPYEKRYPYLDRDVLEFVYAIPREQLVRPGQRRSLMRRALSGIVPNEILHRRRKAIVTRSPLVTMAKQYEGLLDVCKNMVSGSLGVIIPEAFLEALEDARRGKEVATIPLNRTLCFEYWLQNLKSKGLLVGSTVLIPSAFLATAKAEMSIDPT
jgi:asparagine synthase (glutamine-hydrolysing)